jgi:serine/threonine-protein kinase
VRPGEILAEKYRVERVLGMGGMGVVVAARHLQLDDRVALKFLLPTAAPSSEIVMRFGREARAAAKIRSEHIARIRDVGTLASGAPYLVMEFLDGVDLAGALKQRERLPVQDVVEYVLQACEALAEAHALGIVHRDLKPANLFLTRRPDGSSCIKVLDFGISKVAADLGDAAVTSTQAVMGSPLYMSPEQMLSSKDVDPRSDIWALGVILYELLTGNPPFEGESMAQLVLRVANEAPRPMRDRRPDLPEGLEAVVLRCLEKSRTNRFQHVGELALALYEYGPKRARVSVERISGMVRAAGMSGTALQLPPSSEPIATGDAAAAGTGVAWSETRPGARVGRTGTKVALFVGAAALAGGAWFSMRDQETGAAAAAQASTPTPATAPVLEVSAASEARGPQIVPQPSTGGSSVEATSPSAPSAAAAREPAVRAPKTSTVRGAASPKAPSSAAAVAHTPATPPPATPMAASPAPPPPAPAAPRKSGFDFGGRN